MANKRPPWKIPAVIDPPARRCIQIEIPDDPEHIAIFWGLLRSLSDWQRWEREPTRSGTLVAKVWSEVVYAVDFSEDSCMGCCPEPTNRRYNAEGQLEVSYDNGATWAIDPAADDRFSGIIAPPLPGTDGSDKACIGATSATEYVKANLIDSLTTGMTFAELNAAGVALIALLGVTGIGILIAAFAAAVFLAGVAAVQAAFTSEVWTDFRCILSCHILPDASFDAAAWESVKSDILAKFTGVVSAVLYNWVNSVGLVGLTNSARSGFAASGDCSDCLCEDCSNLTNWEVVYGTILEQTAGYIKMQSGVAGPNQSIRLANYTSGATPQCCAVTYNIISGVVQNQAYYPCNSGDPVFSVPPSGTCMYDINLTNIFAVPFVAEFFFAECP